MKRALSITAVLFALCLVLSGCGKVQHAEKLIEEIDNGGAQNVDFSVNALRYAFIVCSIIPIIVIYPKLQKYFAAGVNVGGVKE